MKSARGARPDDDAPDVTEAPAAPSAEQALAAEPQAADNPAHKFLKDPPAPAAGDASGSSDDEGEGGGETRGKVLQRHKKVRRRRRRWLLPPALPIPHGQPTACRPARPLTQQEAKAMKEQAKRLGKKGKEEAARLEAEMEARWVPGSAAGPTPGAAAVLAPAASTGWTLCGCLAERWMHPKPAPWFDPARAACLTLCRHAAELAALDSGKQRTAAEAVAVADSLYSVHLAEDGEQAGGGGKVRWTAAP